MKPETKALRKHVAQIIEPLRLRCEFILRRGQKSGKRCGRRAKESEINGVGKIKSKLCWRHRMMLKKEYNADIVAIES